MKPVRTTLTMLLLIVSLCVLARAQEPCAPDMVFVPSGSFMMGCSQDDTACKPRENPAEYVRLTRSFCLDTHEVTQARFEEVMGHNPSEFLACGPDCPVERVTWPDAAEFCKRVGKRLPTEAEWEYAARAGRRNGFLVDVTYRGNMSVFQYNHAVDSYAWYYLNSAVAYGGCYDLSPQYGAPGCAGTNSVATRRPNPWGLYDIQGSVWEWVQDCFEEDWYERMPMRDPVNDHDACLARVLRGGAWDSPPDYLRQSMRAWDYIDHAQNNYGFRCAQD